MHRSWLQDTLKRKFVDFAWNRRFFLFTRRVLAFLRIYPAEHFNQPDFFKPGRLFFISRWVNLGWTRGNRKGGGGQKRNRLVLFSRYLAANDVVRCSLQVGVYKILLLPILYGVKHTNGRSEEESYTVQSLCNSGVLGWAMQVGGGHKRMVDSCTIAST